MHVQTSNIVERGNVFTCLFYIALFIPFMLSGCGDQRIQTITYEEYQPVYMSEQEFKSAVDMEEPRPLREPGKIYFYNDYLFVNEVNKGVHIIDNRDPASPSRVGFVNIPANKDIAVKGDYLYADSQHDLLVFDLSNMQNVELVYRKEDVFKFTNSDYPGFPYQQIDPSKGIVVDWKKVEVHETCKGDCYGYSGRGILMADGANASAPEAPAGGTGGSLARFAITGEYLYAVDDKNLLTFDISAQEPMQASKKEVGWAIETIFPHKSNLFIGSQSAMYIYDISIPDAPSQLSRYPHFTACDPVVVEGNFAYVTLRTGNTCARGVNRLDVINIEDPRDPRKVGFYGMINPHGLGIDDGNLFVSEGDKGLKILDASDPYNVDQRRHITDIKARDVIPFDNVLMVTGEEGILQYDYSDINDVKLLSRIPVQQDESDQ